MDHFTLLGIALALAMDAFSVALATSLSLPKLTGRHLFRLGWHFGLFQGLMPILGWFGGRLLSAWVASYAHWVAFILLAGVGLHMIREAFHKEETEKELQDPTRGWSLIMLSVATSIDALIIGFSLAVLGVSIWYPALIIGLVASLLTVVGMLIGRRIGQLWDKLEYIGGVVLILLGLKILLEGPS